jgi:hypothetical protein
MSKLIPIGETGRLFLRVGRLTKAEENDWYRRNAGVVAFTRRPPAPDAASPPPTLTPEQQALVRRLELWKGRSMTRQEISLSIAQAEMLGEL